MRIWNKLLSGYQSPMLAGGDRGQEEVEERNGGGAYVAETLGNHSCG